MSRRSESPPRAPEITEILPLFIVILQFIFQTNEMESSSQHQAQRTVQYASRTDIRRAINNIVRRILLLRLRITQQRADGSATPARLNKAQRCRALQRSHIFEDILYRRANSIEEYQDLSTLEERVYRAGRAVYINAQRREMEMESQRRVMNGDTGQAGEEPGQSGRMVLPSQVANRPNNL